MSKEQKERLFVGKGVKANNYDLINISIAESKISPHWFEYNGERYVKLTVGALREVDKFGKTHSVWINDYKPDSLNQNNTLKMEKAPLEDDMPF